MLRDASELILHFSTRQHQFKSHSRASGRNSKTHITWRWRASNAFSTGLLYFRTLSEQKNQIRIKFCRQAKKSIYDYAVETNDPNIVSILVQAGCQRTSWETGWRQLLNMIWLYTTTTAVKRIKLNLNLALWGSDSKKTEKNLTWTKKIRNWAPQLWTCLIRWNTWKVSGAIPTLT